MEHADLIDCTMLQPMLAACVLDDRTVDHDGLLHLAECAHCRRQLQGYAQVVRVLPYDAPDQVPSPLLRE